MKKVTLAIIALAVLVVPSAAEPKRTRHPACYSKGSVTVAASSRIRVYQVRKRLFEGEPVYLYTVACLRRTNNRTTLSQQNQDEPGRAIDRIVLAGDYVAFGWRGFQSAIYFVEVSTLVPGQGPALWHTTDLGNEATCPGPSTDRVTDLELRGNAHVAWVACGGAGKRETGGPVWLDPPGSGVVADSLARSGDHLYWLRGPEPRTSTLR